MTTEDNSSGNGGNNNANTKRNNRKSYYKNKYNTVGDLKNFEGEIPELGAILSLLSEKVEKGVTFDVFQERLKNHILKSFQKAKDITSLATELVDLRIEFEAKHGPTNLSTIKAGNMMNIRKWEIKCKNFLNRQEILIKNVHKIYGIVIGQCTPTLRSTLKSDNDYNNKSAVFDAKWLLDKLKILMAGVDPKANAAHTLHKQVLTFFNTRQGQNESYDNYLVRFNSRVRVLEMSGGKHIFVSKNVLDKEINAASD